MDIVQQEVSIFNDKLKQKAELVFDSCLDYSKDVELTLFSSEIGEYKFQSSDFYSALFGLRALLEPKDIVICMKGCRLDFICSSMGQQMSQGMV